MPGGFIKQHNSMLSILHQLFDALLVTGLLMLIVWYQGVDWSFVYQFLSLFAAFFFYILAHKHGLYVSWRGQSLLTEVRYVFITWAVVVGTFLIVSFVAGLVTYYKQELIVVWVFMVPVLISSYRVLSRFILRGFRRLGFNTREVVIVGRSRSGQRLADRMRESAWMGVSVKGYYDTNGCAHSEKNASGVAYLGNIDALIKDARAGRFDEVYIALPMSEEAVIEEIVTALTDSSCFVHLLPDIFTFKLVNSRTREVAGLPVISVYDSPYDSLDRVVKRVEDIVVASMILAIVIIPMLFIALIVKVTSPGPVIFKQRRYGVNGEEIKVWKYRTMYCCEDDVQVKQAEKVDRRITSVGSFLRRTSLDELPQFINVLQGTMSIVGPRPHAVAHNELYRDKIDGYMQRHLVKPGITGWAQVNGWRGETDTLDKMQKRVEFDLFYIRNWSLWLDLKIILLTCLKGFVHPMAY